MPSDTDNPNVNPVPADEPLNPNDAPQPSPGTTPVYDPFADAPPAPLEEPDEENEDEGLSEPTPSTGLEDGTADA